jgi:rhodanese-related sulfurtransferase
MLSILKSIFGKNNLDYADLTNRKALIIDVRSPREFASGNAKGSINIPLGDIANHINKIKKQNKPVITCCRSGARSASAAATLENAGIEVYNGGSWNGVQQALNQL